MGRGSGSGGGTGAWASALAAGSVTFDEFQYTSRVRALQSTVPGDCGDSRERLGGVQDRTPAE